MKSKALIVDIDGTLSNNEERAQMYLNKEPKDWVHYYGDLENDKLMEWCYELVLAMHQTHAIILLTGREEKYREVTIRWLMAKEVPYTVLLMRPEGDYRQDFEIKREVYEESIKPYYDIMFCIDDRKQVVDMWREIGLVCLDCAGSTF
jgi:hypothetical protein